MKILVEVQNAPDLDQATLINNPTIPDQIAAFVARLVKFHSRAPAPIVQCELLPETAVIADVDALIRLQEKVKGR